MAVLIAALFATAFLAGCGDAKQNNSGQPNKEQAAGEEYDQGQWNVGQADSEKENVDSKSDQSSTVTPVPIGEIDRSHVFELFSHMTVGWNLGNTFDAIGAGDTLSSETYWGNPKTTKEMIDVLAQQGFNTVRIPVTWAEHVGPAPDYMINEAWLDRVEEVVDYCLEDDMYVILDTHHEPDFWMSLAQEDMDATKAELAAIWTQIAERFKDRDEHLLFEGMNEPRTKGSAAEWSGGTGPERVAVNELNGVFIDAVRAVGGKNSERCLIICPYGNNASSAALQNLRIYDDPNIAVAVHLYTPYFFTYDPDQGSILEWDGSLKSEITSTLSLVDSFLLKKDVPVIVTEFGAVNKGRTEEVIRWAEDYLSAMNSYGIKCIWWDNGIYTGQGERFGILDRRNLTWFSREIADVLVENAMTGQ